MKKTFLALIAILSLVACSSDDDSQEQNEPNNLNLSYKLVYTTQHLDPSIQVYAGTTIDYYDGTFEFIHTDYDMEANTVTIETELGPTKIETNFYIQNGTEVDIVLSDSNGNVIDELTIHEVNHNYVYEF